MDGSSLDESIEMSPEQAPASAPAKSGHIQASPASYSVDKADFHHGHNAPQSKRLKRARDSAASIADSMPKNVENRAGIFLQPTNSFNNTSRSRANSVGLKRYSPTVAHGSANTSEHFLPSGMGQLSRYDCTPVNDTSLFPHTIPNIYFQTDSSGHQDLSSFSYQNASTQAYSPFDQSQMQMMSSMSSRRSSQSNPLFPATPASNPTLFSASPCTPLDLSVLSSYPMISLHGPIQPSQSSQFGSDLTTPTSSNGQGLSNSASGADTNEYPMSALTRAKSHLGVSRGDLPCYGASSVNAISTAHSATAMGHSQPTLYKAASCGIVLEKNLTPNYEADNLMRKKCSFKLSKAVQDEIKLPAGKFSPDILVERVLDEVLKYAEKKKADLVKKRSEQLKNLQDKTEQKKKQSCVRAAAHDLKMKMITTALRNALDCFARTPRQSGTCRTCGAAMDDPRNATRLATQESSEKEGEDLNWSEFDLNF